MSTWMAEHLRPIVDSLVYSLLGSLVMLLCFWIIEKILPFSMRKEIEEDHNVSFGIILGAFILGISLIVASAIH